MVFLQTYIKNRLYRTLRDKKQKNFSAGTGTLADLMQFTRNETGAVLYSRQILRKERAEPVGFREYYL